MTAPTPHERAMATISAVRDDLMRQCGLAGVVVVPPPPRIGGPPSTLRRTPADCVVLHQSAVRGGFGPPPGTPPEQRRTGIIGRYALAPYHTVCAPHLAGGAAVLDVWHPSRRTPHAGPGGNDCIGLAYDDHVRAGDELTTEQITLWRLAVVHTCWRTLMRRGESAVVYLATHRQSSDDRGGDPGPQLFRAVAPWATEATDAVVRVRRGVLPRARSGADIPDSWFGQATGEPRRTLR